jgi:hypothetical protein
MAKKRTAAGIRSSHIRPTNPAFHSSVDEVLVTDAGLTPHNEESSKNTVDFDASGRAEAS